MQRYKILAVSIGILGLGVFDLANMACRAEAGKNNDAIRLPRTVMPTSYKLYFEPDLENKQFSGEETIFVDVQSPVKEVLLNANDLEVSEGEIAQVKKGKGHGAWAESTIEQDKEKQLVRFKFKKTIAPGSYEFHVKFAGKLNDKMAGFYYSSSTDAAGNKMALATTQMEPTDARRVFPCFDEPDFKATFNITLATPPDLVAISNAPLKFKRTDPRTQKTQYTFEETPLMSTYLVALIVGPFEATDSQIVNNVEIKTWAVKGKKEQALYGRDTAIKLLPFFEDYFGTPYPMKKLDLIAIPDFSSGAMENLGAITFRESRLLLDPKTASVTTKQGVAMVVAHEMAHMWFGDLVTMKWWDDLWLNEAFASWMEPKALDFLQPDWKPWDSFVSDKGTAMETDALYASRPIYAKVNNPEDAEQMFDEITYEKGASVLRMLERYVGEDVYKKGIQNYIAKFKFKNATTDDLWNSIQEVSGSPVSKIMKEWVYSAGYPLVEVEFKGSEDIKLSQRPFRLLDAAKAQSKTTSGDAAKAHVWQIPVSYRQLAEDQSARATKRATHIMDTVQEDLAVASNKSPFVVNVHSDGYYRVSYPKEALKSLSALAQKELTVPERYSLLSDSFALVEAGKLPCADYLDLTAGYKDETDPTVMGLLINHLAQINLFIKDADRANFAALVRDRLSGCEKRLGWQKKDGESDLTQILRGDVLDALGTIGESQAVITKAREMFGAYCNNPESINPDLNDTIAGVIAYNGTKEDYDTLFKLYKEAKTPEAKLRNLMSLSVFRQPDLIKRTLDLALTDDVKTQDAPHLVQKSLRSVAGRQIAWQYIKDNWTKMNERYPSKLFIRIVRGATSIVEPKMVDDMTQFLSTHPVHSGDRVIAKVIERGRINAAFNTAIAADLSTWLSKYTPVAPM
ncbi:MAG: M1 family metallopeptidase [Candidatus Melainabacteria bacterium]|nr:MAG: M1 family metallopeptidase [Candidatus Melainabacteria bacterium]